MARERSFEWHRHACATTLLAIEASDDNTKLLSCRGVHAISIADHPEHTSDLSRKKTLEAEKRYKDEALELERNHAGWTSHSTTSSSVSSASYSPRTTAMPQDYDERGLYERIARLNQTAESVYQFAKQTTTMMGSSSAASGLSYHGAKSLLMTRIAAEDELD